MEDFAGFADDWLVVDADSIKQEINEKGLSGLKAICERKQNDWKKIPLNVGVTGNSGTGKSSFINAIRGLDADDEGAAIVDEVEATMDVRAYPHPLNDNLQFWDLPGVGTPRFPQASYLEAVGFDRYDFFLILSRDRFTENDMWLAREINNRQKKFFFVRTKIDNAVNDDKRAHRKTHNEALLLDRIKKDCIEKLSSVLDFEPDVFLISIYDQHKFEFRRLTDKLIADFPALKREAMIMSLNIMTENIIKQKAEILRSRVWTVAAMSAVGGAIPIPGLSAVVDVTIITLETNFYRKQFGLDDESLEAAARDANVSLNDIKKQYASVLMLLSAENVAVCLGQIAVSEFAETMASVALPIIGSVIAAGLSYKVTSSFLWEKIDELEEASLAINRFLTEQVSSTLQETEADMDKLCLTTD